jgi:hypothetical protein
MYGQQNTKLYSRFSVVGLLAWGDGQCSEFWSRTYPLYFIPLNLNRPTKWHIHMKQQNIIKLEERKKIGYNSGGGC